MRSICISTTILVAALVVVAGSPAWAQITDDFEGTYVTQSAAGYSGPAAPGWVGWSDGWGSGNTYSEATPGHGGSGSNQRITANYGSGGLLKTFSVTEGKFIQISVWIKTSNAAGSGAATTSSWVEYGWDPTGVATAEGEVLWDPAPKNEFGANYNTWTEYTMPVNKVVRATSTTIAVWVKTGSVGGGGVRADFDDLTIDELDSPPGLVAGDLPDTFDGTYSEPPANAIAPGWYEVWISGGADINRAKIAGRTGDAQRIYTEDADLGIVKLFNAPTLTNLRLSIWARTADADGSDPFAPTGNRIIAIGYDITGQIFDMSADTITWDESVGRAGATPFNTWTQFITPTFVLGTGQDTISVWLEVRGWGGTAGSRADFDDLELFDLGPISGAANWEIYR